MSGDSFKAVLLEMYENKRGFDFKVHIKGSEKVFEVHKLVLALASETFYNSLYGPKAIKSNSALSLKGISVPTFEKILGFIYGKKIEFENLKDAKDFYKNSFTLKCKDALEFVTNYLLSVLKIQNAIEIYEIGAMDDNAKLVSPCLKMFGDFTNTLLDSPEFLTAHPRTVDAIFKLEKLNIDSELDLVRALEHYIKINIDANPNVASKVRPALGNIRWLTLPAKDIAHTTLLSNHEIVNVIGCLPPEEDKSKMPPYLSQSTEKRNMIVPRHRLARLLHDKFATFCFKCCTFSHAIWGCKKTFPPSRKTQLKRIYEKYGHTFLLEYNDVDLQTIYNLFVEFDIFNE